MTIISALTGSLEAIWYGTIHLIKGFMKLRLIATCACSVIHAACVSAWAGYSAFEALINQSLMHLLMSCSSVATCTMNAHAMMIAEYQYCDNFRGDAGAYALHQFRAASTNKGYSPFNCNSQAQFREQEKNDRGTVMALQPPALSWQQKRACIYYR